MTDKQFLQSLQGTMATIDPMSIKREEITEYRLGMIEERLTSIEDKLQLLIDQLRIEFYKPTND